MDRITARKISFLPHRQSFFRRGGWKMAPLPSSTNFLYFLNENFSRQEQDVAQKRAEASPDPSGIEDGFVSLWGPGYPMLLREIFDPPPILFFKLFGNDFPAPDQSFVSIVGTRRAHQICLQVTKNILQNHTENECDYWSVSGFALGVDRLVHRESLRSGMASVAVLASGMGSISPRRNLDLIHVAQETHTPLLFLSEYPQEITANAWHFPRRNRIIAGLSESLYCIQAPRKSGAMITARFAMDEGRDVYAYDDANLKNILGANEGARSLLEDGALLISTVPQSCQI